MVELRDEHAGTCGRYLGNDGHFGAALKVFVCTLPSGHGPDHEHEPSGVVYHDPQAYLNGAPVVVGDEHEEAREIVKLLEAHDKEAVESGDFLPEIDYTCCAEAILASDWLRERDARIWDDGYEAAARFHEGREKGHWERDFPREGLRTWMPDPAPENPFRRPLPIQGDTEKEPPK